LRAGDRVSAAKSGRGPECDLHLRGCRVQTHVLVVGAGRRGCDGDHIAPDTFVPTSP